MKKKFIINLLQFKGTLLLLHRLSNASTTEYNTGQRQSCNRVTKSY